MTGGALVLLAAANQTVVVQSGIGLGSAVVGTDWNLVNRLRLRYPDKRISCLKEDICPCVTMNRIDLPKLTWCLESLAAGELVNPIHVEEGMRRWGRVALDRMLALA